jgi:predicted ATPase
MPTELIRKSAEEKLRRPQPGSAMARARDYGIDLTLLIERLRRTPEERVRDLQRAIKGMEAMRGRARLAARPSADESQRSRV